ATAGGINRRLVSAGSGTAGGKAGRAPGRVGSGGRPGEGGRRRWWRGSRCSSVGGEDRVHRGAEGSRRQQDQCDQGCPRGHQPGPEGSQGAGGWSAKNCEGRRLQGRGRDHEEEVHRCRGHRRGEVASSAGFGGARCYRLGHVRAGFVLQCWPRTWAGGSGLLQMALKTVQLAAKNNVLSCEANSLVLTSISLALLLDPVQRGQG